MSVKQQIQEILDKFKVNLAVEEQSLMATATLDSGQVVHTDADAFAAGANVYIKNDEGEQIPVPNGEYTLEDGTMFNVLDGVIAEQEAPEPAEAEDLSAAIRPIVAEMLEAALQPIVEALEALKPVEEKFSAPKPLARKPVAKSEPVQPVDLAALSLSERVAAIQKQFQNHA
jgi:hypothetical protein